MKPEWHGECHSSISRIRKLVRTQFMNMAVILLLISLVTKLFVSTIGVKIEANATSIVLCQFYKEGPNLDVRDMVGVWMTVYTHPKTLSCFTLHVRSTTELEREQNMINYGNFSGRVDWLNCKLEVESTLGKHYLQGDGSLAGLLENIIVTEDEKGVYVLQEQTSDQWTIFGRRGSELLLMRDCSGEAVAVFARAPYWPSTTDLYAILHRSGIAPLTHQRVLCEPLDVPSRHCFMNNYYNARRF